MLGGAAFVRETPEVCCVWQNTLDPRDDSVEIQLDFFAREKGDRYRRYSECFREAAWPREEVQELLKAEGFRLLELRGDSPDAPPGPREERVVYIARRE